MKTYEYSCYVSDFLHSGLIDAENEVDCITKITKQIQHPELMRGLMIDLHEEPLASLVAKNNDLRAKIKEYEECIDYYETRNLELVAKNDELETQLLQYKIYISDITTAIQKNICKDFCPNIGQPT